MSSAFNSTPLIQRGASGCLNRHPRLRRPGPGLLEYIRPYHGVTLVFSSVPQFSSPEELKSQAASLEGAQSELSRVQAQLEQAQADMENIKAVATVSESTKQEAVDQVKGQWQEEVTSLQAIMKGS